MKITEQNKLFFRLKSMQENRLLFILSVFVGICSGLAAVLLKQSVHFMARIAKTLIDNPQYSFFYILLPGVGIFLSFLLIKYLIKDNIGHGVTKVLIAISRHDSRIKPHNIWSSIVTSTVTIGFGGSVGAEAPIVYTGAAIGSNIARTLGLSYKHMTILLGCGAAGAVAGIFKAPLAGVLFTLEILLFNISMTSLLPLLTSAVTATAVSYFLLGNTVVFNNDIMPFNLGNLPYYILLGVLTGFVSLYFTRVTISTEDRLGKIKNPYFKWILSATGLGILIFLFPPLYGEGYDSLTSLLNNDIPSAIGSTVFGDLFSSGWFIPVFFIAIIIFKVFAMTFTNAGGGVGGTFGPTLFIGGVTGFVVARIINLSGLHPLPEANFALVGMAGLMSGVMLAPLTAIFLIAEITGGYELIMPLIITSAISFATIRTFESYSIYTKRIAKQGSLLTHDNDQAVLTLMKTDKLIETDFTSVSPDALLEDLIKIVAGSKRNLFPVVDRSGYLKGIIILDDIRNIMFERELYKKITVKQLMCEPVDFVRADDSMESVMSKFDSTSAWNLPVLDKDLKYAGFVSKSKIFSEYRNLLQQVSHD
jgi:CIC family chloride channel protein